MRYVEVEQLENKMDIILFIVSGKNASHVNLVRGDKKFVQKTLEQVYGISKVDIQILFSSGRYEINKMAFTVHENFNSVKKDMDSLKSILAVLMDIQRFQTGEYVKILRDTIIHMERTIQNIYTNFSE